MKSTEGEEGDSGGNEVAEPPQELSTEDNEQHLSFPQNVQQSEMVEQLCDQDKITATTSQTSNFSSVPELTTLDPEKFFQLVAECQRRRMDDQRVSMNLLPGIQIYSSKGSALMNKWESDQLCNFVIRAQSSRMEDQRCTPPQIILTPDTPVTQKKSFSRPASPTHDPDTISKPLPRSATFSPSSHNDSMQTEHNTPIQTLTPAEQERLLSLICVALRGRMEDQRCYLDPNMRTHPSPEISNILPEGMDPEQFFKLVAKIQSHRLDDQRVALGFLPGIQTPNGDIQTPLTTEEAERFYNILSRVQSQRMEEQRCYAPHIQLGTPAPPRKVWTSPDSTVQDKAPSGPESSGTASRRSSSVISPPAETPQWHQNNSNHTPQTPYSTEQDQYFSLVHQVRRWMENHLHGVDPNALSTEQFFTLVANSQSKRMDDQRATMPQPNQIEKPTIPQIVLTPGSPAALTRASSRPTSLIQEPDPLTRPPPRSATFSPISEKERMQYDSNVSAKLTFQVSVCLTPPRQGSTMDGQQVSYPDVFLTIGTPGGEGIVVPITPQVCSPRPRRHHSRSSSPHRAHSRTPHHRPSPPNPTSQPCPISPDEDYFSLIQKVHTAQLLRGNTTEKCREPGKGRVKVDGERERKDRFKRK